MCCTGDHCGATGVDAGAEASCGWTVNTSYSKVAGVDATAVKRGATEGERTLIFSLCLRSFLFFLFLRSMTASMLCLRMPSSSPPPPRDAAPGEGERACPEVERDIERVIDELGFEFAFQDVLEVEVPANSPERDDAVSVVRNWRIWLECFERSSLVIPSVCSMAEMGESCCCCCCGGAGSGSEASSDMSRRVSWVDRGG